jgi:opacity protein-like surface antigen
LYVDFGSISTSANVNLALNNPNLFSTSADFKANIVRAGLNYKF